MVATSCDLNAPRCTTKAQQVTFCTGPRGGVLHWSPTPPGDPGDPPALKYKNIIYYNMMNPQSFHVCSEVPHTHTHPAFGQGGCPCNEVKMKMERGMKMKYEKWKWDEWLLNRVPEEGIAKEEGRRKHTPTPLARSGQTLKGQGKRKAEVDGHGTRPAEGGKDVGSGAKTYAYLGTRRTHLPREGRTHEMGDHMGD